MSRGRIVVVYGTRPEAIKIGPVVAELRARGTPVTIVCTGQHTDLLRGTPSEKDLGGAVSLDLPAGGEIAEWVRKATPAILSVLQESAPIACVVVQGDVMSAYAGAIAAKLGQFPLAHVEAGLRSHTPLEPWPEESIRKAISQKADWHFCPTETSRANLEAEGITRGVHVTGNTVVSAIARYGSLEHVPVPDQQIMVTMHRREWLGMGQDFVRLTIDALLNEAEDHPSIRFLWPMHPHVLKVSNIDPRDTPPNLLISPPLAYAETLKQLARSMGLATDSGGLQEEAATLGVPCAVLRNVSDRPESIEAGVAQLYSPSPVGILGATKALVHGDIPRRPSDCYGTEGAAGLIADVLMRLAG